MGGSRNEHMVKNRFTALVKSTLEIHPNKNEGSLIAFLVRRASSQVAKHSEKEARILEESAEKSVCAPTDMEKESDMSERESYMPEEEEKFDVKIEKFEMMELIEERFAYQSTSLFG